MQDQYRVWITFNTGDRHLDTDWCDVTELQDSLRRLIHGPISKLHVISEIRVIDMSDCTVYLIQDDRQVFPEVA